jgi:cysteinyl-tRNA synthetase
VYLFDSSRKTKEKFVPQNKDIVNIYLCGPTVYDYAHLGHARSAIVFDLLHRILLHNKYKVYFVKNYTDIDDKIIKKAQEENKSIEEISSFYIQEDIKTMQSLSLIEPTLQPKATEYINKIIDLINNLLQKNIAYILNDGVYFDTSKDKDYGSISHRIQDDGMARIDNNTNKKNNSDFALWKFEEKKDITYNASFGRGRPGWHSECSAMINDIFKNNNKYMLDIHCGGSDLLFPHHENEATQIRCASNKEISKYWLHNGFVQIDNEKMSKSLKNSFYVKDILKDYHSEVVRLYLMQTHYRANFNFSLAGLDETKKTLDKIYRLKKTIYDINKSTSFDTTKIIDALNDDINISKAISYINEYISSINDFFNKIDNKNDIKNKKLEIKSFFDFLNDVLAIGNDDVFDYFHFKMNKEEIKNIDELIEKRNSFRANKDFINADKIRDELISKNISIMDTSSGTKWEQI